ncbi:MAG: hypothetical protein KUG65_03130 [Sphingomonadaceae bacterium]|nr:hypothetical protein [Sphingomonadaceae bacterium]
MQLRRWIEAPEWTPWEAAHILLNLDPENTEHPTEQEGWSCWWLYRGAEFPTSKSLAKMPKNEVSNYIYSRDHGLTRDFSQMRRLVSHADPLAVRTSRHWLAWAETHDLLPDWLRKLGTWHPAACLEKVTAVPAPVSSAPEILQAPEETDTSGVSIALFPNPISAAGGKQKARNSLVGQIKEYLWPRIEEWWGREDRGTARDYAKKLLDEIEAGPEHEANPDLGPTQETIENWIRQVRKALVK